MRLKVVRPFLFMTMVIFALQSCKAEPKILGESVRKFRVKGILETKTSWQSLPAKLSHHMGTYQRLKVTGLKADTAEVTYTIEGEEKRSSYIIEETTGIFKEFNFDEIIDDALKAPSLNFTFYLKKKIIKRIQYQTSGKIK